MRKTLAAVGLTLALLVAPTVVPAAVANTASAAVIQYECRKWNWFLGWQVKWTTNLSEVRHLTANGWHCICRIPR